MKKILLTMVAALTAVTFTNCQKDEAFTPEQVGTPFEIVASPETRTVNDGMSTKWADGDAVNVFHAVEGSTDNYINDGEFTLADVTTGTFTGTLTGDALTEDSNYDWYMFYPYSSYIKTPANTDAGYMPVGSKASATQTQTGINSMAHIAGENYPMAGKVEGVMGGEKPSITMKHVSALVRVNVTNNNAEAINVTSIKLTAPEDIIGTYYINFAGETPEFTGSGTSYVSSTATLTVTDGTIEAGETAAFYLAIKPINLENGDLTVSVATEGNDLFAKTFTGLTTAFSAGKIKTINVKHEAKISEDFTGANFELVTDASTLAVGDKVVIAAAESDAAMSTNQKTNNRGQVQITKQGNYIVAIDSEVEVFTLEAGAVEGSYAFKSGSGYIYAASSESNHLKTQASLDANASWSISIADGIATMVAQGTNTRNTMQHNEQSSLFACYAQDKPQKPVAIYRHTVEDVRYLTPSATEISVEASATTATFTVESNVAWTATSADATVSTNENTVTVAFEANTEEIEKSYTVTVTPEETTLEPVTVTIKQAAYAAPVEPTGTIYAKVTTAPADWSGTYLIVHEDGTNGHVFNGEDAVNGYASATIDNNTITGSYENYEVTIASMADGYSIYCSNGYMSGTSGSNKLNFGASAAANTIVLTADQTTTITSNTSVLRFNNASNQMRFRYYKSTSYASQQAITLYKKVE